MMHENLTRRVATKIRQAYFKADDPTNPKRDQTIEDISPHRQQKWLMMAEAAYEEIFSDDVPPPIEG
jgi:hypothetical protein